jgi:hypothetical protein
MSYYIHGKVQKRVVTLVGYTTSADIPGDTIILKKVERNPEAHMVKWSLRFADSLADKKILDHPFAAYFTNSARTKRFLEEEDFDQICAEENAKFLKLHHRRPELFQTLLERALAEKHAGRTLFSIRKLFLDIRWCETEIERGAEQYKVDDTWGAWYSRLLQMMERNLVGFFRVRAGVVADALALADGSTWKQFAAENEGNIKWTDQSDELLSSDSEDSE